jgi:hypothetical protein
MSPRSSSSIKKTISLSRLIEQVHFTDSLAKSLLKSFLQAWSQSKIKEYPSFSNLVYDQSGDCFFRELKFFEDSPSEFLVLKDLFPKESFVFLVAFVFFLLSQPIEKKLSLSNLLKFSQNPNIRNHLQSFILESFASERISLSHELNLKNSFFENSRKKRLVCPKIFLGFLCIFFSQILFPLSTLEIRSKSNFLSKDRSLLNRFENEINLTPFRKVKKEFLIASSKRRVFPFSKKSHSILKNKKTSIKIHVFPWGFVELQQNNKILFKSHEPLSSLVCNVHSGSLLVKISHPRFSTIEKRLFVEEDQTTFRFSF